MVIKKNLKFTDKYKVKLGSVYRGDPSRVKVPPPGHPLYDPSSPTTFDELMAQEIDANGNMNSAIEVWTDPDKSLLWIIDGRGRQLATEEVNRRRKNEGREPVELLIVRFTGTEAEAVRRIQVKNNHRRIPTLSSQAMSIASMRKAGYPWAACLSGIHIQSDDPEQFCRRLLPLAFCIPEVQEQIDGGRLSRLSARKFGGTDPEGKKALGREAQLDLLSEMLAETPKEKVKGEDRPISAGAKQRMYDGLGAAKKDLAGDDKEIARIVIQTMAFLQGKEKALDYWPEVAKIAKAAVPRPVKEKVEPEA